MKYARLMLPSCYILVSVFLFLSLVSCERGYYRGGNRGYILREDNRGERNYYRDGRWYRHDARGGEIAVDVLVSGALIESLPPRHTSVVVENNTYYHDDRYYYKQHPNGGYVVVPEPVIVQPRSQSKYDKRGEKGDSGHNEENRGQNH